MSKCLDNTKVFPDFDVFYCSYDRIISWRLYYLSVCQSSKQFTGAVQVEPGAKLQEIRTKQHEEY